METVTSFKYLGRVLTAGDDNWTEVEGKLRKTRKIWVRMTRILIRNGAELKILGLFFKAVLQTVLLFRAETWVLNPHMYQALRSFQHRVAQWLTGRYPRQRGERRWEYPLLAAVMAEAGFEDIGVYITRKQNTVAQYIATRPILEIYEKPVRRPGAWVYRQWWDQEGLDLEGVKERVMAESDGEEEKCGEEAVQEETPGRD